MAIPSGYTQLPTGEFMKDSDGSGPYVFSGTAMMLAATGSGGGGGGGDASAANQVTQIAAEQAIQATLGATNGAAVVTDANGTVQQYLRGLIVKMLVLIAQFPASLGTKTAANSLAVTPSSDGVFLVAGATATRTDKSGTITLGGTAQNAIASNAARKGFEIQNQSTGNLWFSTLAAAVQGQPSVLISPGALYETPLGGAGTGAVSIIGATTGQAFAAREWT